MSAEDGQPDGVYRYALYRQLDGPYSGVPGYECNLLWLMLNPSTADHEVDDATIRRVMGFSRRFGADACTVVNLFALRSTDPRYLRGHPDPVGPYNDQVLTTMSSAAQRVVCAYGALGAFQDRAQHVLKLLRGTGSALLALGVTKDGHPRHPLYLPNAAELQDFVG